MSVYRLAKFAGLAIVLLAVGSGSFFAAGALADLVRDEKTGEPEETILPPEGFYFDGNISGTRVITNQIWKAEGRPPQSECAIPIKGANNYPVSIEEAVGTPLEITPTYLPAGAVEKYLDPTDYLTPPAMVCGGQISRALRTYLHESGRFSIEKWRGPNVYVGDLQAAYVSAGEINGKPAIFVRRSPSTRNIKRSVGATKTWSSSGFVIIPEEFGFTVVRVDGIRIPFEEAVKIAEGLK